MNEHRKLALRKENLSELTRHELQSVAGGDVSLLDCIAFDLGPTVATMVTCGGYTIATCTCPTGASCVCPTMTCGCL